MRYVLPVALRIHAATLQRIENEMSRVPARCLCKNPVHWAARSTGGWPVCTRQIRVRFPGGPPSQSWCRYRTARGRRRKRWSLGQDRVKSPALGLIPDWRNGRRTCLRNRCRKAWGFESLIRYQRTPLMYSVLNGTLSLDKGHHTKQTEVAELADAPGSNPGGDPVRVRVFPSVP